MNSLIRSWSPALAALAVTAAALLLTAGPVAAQAPPGASKLWPWNVGGSPQTPAARPSTPTPPPTTYRAATTQRFAVAGPITVTIAQPASPPVYADVRGPDGVVRSYPLEGGRGAIQVRTVTIPPGGSVTVHLGPPAPK